MIRVTSYALMDDLQVEVECCHPGRPQSSHVIRTFTVQRMADVSYWLQLMSIADELRGLAHECQQTEAFWPVECRL